MWRPREGGLGEALLLVLRFLWRSAASGDSSAGGRLAGGGVFALVRGSVERRAEWGPETGTRPLDCVSPSLPYFSAAVWLHLSEQRPPLSAGRALFTLGSVDRPGRAPSPCLASAEGPTGQLNSGLSVSSHDPHTSLRGESASGCLGRDEP